MKRHLVRALAISLLLVGTAVAQEEERQGDTITFKLQTNVIFVEGKINGEGPFHFIFDTGASVTVIRPSTAEKLGLIKKEGDGKKPPGLGNLFGGGMKRIRLKSFGLGKAVVRDFQAVSMGVPQADLPLAMQGIKYDGIVGYNFISRFVTTIDYKKKTIRLVPNDYVPEDPFGGREAPKKGEDAPPRDSGRRAHVGFTFATIGDDLANEIGVEGGVVVKYVAKDSPAAKGGLEKGDVIQEVDGKRVDTADDYRKLLRQLRPGRRVTFRVIRDRKDVEVTIRIGARDRD